ncbi:hypothetical protein [Sphingomonas sp.]
MIDLVSLGTTHALMLIALWRLLNRPDLDRDDGARRPTPWGRAPDA